MCRARALTALFDTASAGIVFARTLDGFAVVSGGAVAVDVVDAPKIVADGTDSAVAGSSDIDDVDRLDTSLSYIPWRTAISALSLPVTRRRYRLIGIGFFNSPRDTIPAQRSY
ncbi:MAG: hypothetical protein J07HX5_01521 [halophilic archaeon J07HX5]|jgi:hypothetical protein|nr:MAG: hypothetical protein J07HX5_01521 [halophilic archaeon J07HX5]